MEPRKLFLYSIQRFPFVEFGGRGTYLQDGAPFLEEGGIVKDVLCTAISSISRCDVYEGNTALSLR